MNGKTGIGSFSSFSIRIVFVLLMMIGVVTIPFLSIQQLPSRSYGSLTVHTRIPGASTEVTEALLTSPIEAALSRLGGVTRISSVSDVGFSQVRLELDKYTDIDIFRFEAATILRQLYTQLPPQTDFPSIYLNRPDGTEGNQPLLGFILRGPGTKQEITAIGERYVRHQVASIEGIHRFEITGNEPGHVAVYADARRMQAADISMADLQQQLGQALGSRHLGTTHFADGKYTLSLTRTVDDLYQLRQLKVKDQAGRIFMLDDLADVSWSEALPRSYYRINGQDLVSMTFWAAENVNTVQLAKKIKDKIEEINALIPAEYVLDLQFDSTTFIKEELDNIYQRTLLSVGILLLFVVLITRHLRYVFIVISALAANVLLSFICYYVLRLDIHLYSLAGVTIALGLVIDNVIVIVEDIRHTGRNRIFAAIFASTLTALGALSIVFFLEDNLRTTLMDFALAIIVNLIISLPIAYFFIPAMLDRYPVQVRKGKLLWGRRRILVGFSRFYRWQLRFMISRRRWFAFLFILAFGLPLFLLPQKIEDPQRIVAHWYNATFGSVFYNEHLRDPLNTYLGGALYFYVSNMGQRSSYAFDSDENNKQTQLYVHITMPVGASLTHMDEVCRGFERIIYPYLGHLETFTTQVSGGTEATIRLLFKRKTGSRIAYLLKNVLEREAVLSGAADFAVYGVGRGFNNAINQNTFESAIELKGYNYQQLQNIALIVRDSLLSYKRVNDLLISSQREWGQRSGYEHVVRFTDPEYLTLYRIGGGNVSRSIQQIGEVTQNLGFLKTYEQQDTEVKLYYGKDQRVDVWNIMHRPLEVDDSTAVRLAGIAEKSKIRVGSRMMRENQEYVLYINYRFIGTYQLNQFVSDKIVGAISSLLPYGYRIRSVGQGYWVGEVTDYLWFIPLVLLIIYMICAVLLESLKQPIAVIWMIPFSFIGVFLTFHVLGIQFDQGGYAALLMLSGMVTNAALYIINDYNYFKRLTPSLHPLKGYVKAFHAKAMPIIVTTAAALLSLLPFMIVGEERGFWFNLSAGTIGGLLFSLLGVYMVLPICLLSPKKLKKEKR